VVQNHHKKHFGLALIRHLTQEAENVPHHLITQPGKTEHFSEPKLQYNMLVFGGRREFAVVSFLLKKL
jgi:hypothetical protein